LLPYGESERPLYVDALREDESFARERIQREHIYHLGAFEGCSCGFRHTTEGAEIEDIEDMKDCVESTSALRDYIRQFALGGKPVIFVCWEGDSSRPIEHVRKMLIEEIGHPGFLFEEGDLIETLVPEPMAGVSSERKG